MSTAPDTAEILARVQQVRERALRAAPGRVERDRLAVQPPAATRARSRSAARSPASATRARLARAASTARARDEDPVDARCAWPPTHPTARRATTRPSRSVITRCARSTTRGSCGREDEGHLLLAIEPLHDVEQVLGGGGVEIRGRLVGEHEGRAARPAPAPPRPAAAGRRRARAAAGPSASPRPTAREQLLGARAGRSSRGPLLQQHDELDVLLRRQHGDQVVGLEDEADVMEPEADELGRLMAADVLAGHLDAPGRRGCRARRQVEQRGLARTRGTDDRGELGFLDARA